MFFVDAYKSNQTSAQEGNLAYFLKNYNLKYEEVPTKFVWDKENKIWTTKQEEKLIDEIVTMEKVYANKKKNKCQNYETGLFMKIKIYVIFYFF